MGYAVYGILQARILEWVAFPFSRRSSQPRGSNPGHRTQVSLSAGGFFTSWATRGALRDGREHENHLDPFPPSLRTPSKLISASFHQGSNTESLIIKRTIIIRRFRNMQYTDILGNNVLSWVSKKRKTHASWGQAVSRRIMIISLD